MERDYELLSQYELHNPDMVLRSVIAKISTAAFCAGCDRDLGRFTDLNAAMWIVTKAFKRVVEVAIDHSDIGLPHYMEAKPKEGLPF